MVDLIPLTTIYRNISNIEKSVPPTAVRRSVVYLVPFKECSNTASGIRIANDLACLDQHSAFTKLKDRTHVMADKKHGSSIPLSDILHLSKAFLLEFGIADRQDLINDQYFAFEVSRDRKGKANVHSRRETLHRSIDGSLNATEIDDLIKLSVDLAFSHT